MWTCTVCKNEYGTLAGKPKNKATCKDCGNDVCEDCFGASGPTWTKCSDCA